MTALDVIRELRENTDFREANICEECGGVGSDENVPFYCSACKGQGSIWSDIDPRVGALLDVAEAANGAACTCEQVCGDSISRRGDALVASRTPNQCAKGRLRVALASLTALGGTDAD